VDRGHEISATRSLLKKRKKKRKKKKRKKKKPRMSWEWGTFRTLLQVMERAWE